MNRFFRVALVAVTMTTAASAVAEYKRVAFLEPVTIGKTRLAAGEYGIEWNGIGAHVQVTFWRNNRKVVTVRAMLRSAQHRYDAVTVRPESSGVNRLLQIDCRDWEVRF